MEYHSSSITMQGDDYTRNMRFLEIMMSGTWNIQNLHTIVFQYKYRQNDTQR